MTGCNVVSLDGILDSYSNLLEQSDELEFVASDLFYDVVMQDSHLNIENNITRSSLYKRGTVDFQNISSSFSRLLKASDLEKCRPTNYWVRITLQTKNKKPLWKAFISGDSKQIMHGEYCYSIEFDASEYLSAF